jgi:hypothetical protein
MQAQNFANHSRKAPATYYLGVLSGLIVFIGSIILVLGGCANCSGCLTAGLLCFLAVGVIFIGYYARMFALKAQDRAIRAEENLRYFSLQGKLLDSRLTLSQVIALRFASDEEFSALAERALKENLNNKQIKQAIQNWKTDFHRV